MGSNEDRERRAMAQREANAHAKERGEALPYPNVWDALDPTKLEHDDPAARAQRYQAFSKLCPKARWKTHVL